VIQIDSVLINNIYHRKWRLNVLNTISTQTSTPYYDVIEGVGCLYAPWFPVYPATFENGWTLYCFSNNSITQSSVSIVNSYPACDSIVLVGIDDVPGKEHIQVFPNPMQANSKIRFPEPLSGRFIISDITGRVLVADGFKDKIEISIGNYSFSPGLYYFSVFDANDQKVHKGKFLSQ
jgi:hypothetical protein